MGIINYQYQIPYYPIKNFEFTDYDEKISVKEYEDRVKGQLPSIIDLLNTIPECRQAVLVMFETNFHSCLLTIQFQIHKGMLYVTINMRSQALEFVDKDRIMFLWIVTQVMNGLKHLIEKVNILVHVGNFHSRKGMKS